MANRRRQLATTLAGTPLSLCRAEVRGHKWLGIVHPTSVSEGDRWQKAMSFSIDPIAYEAGEWHRRGIVAQGSGGSPVRQSKRQGFEELSSRNVASDQALSGGREHGTARGGVAAGRRKRGWQSAQIELDHTQVRARLFRRDRAVAERSPVRWVTQQPSQPSRYHSATIDRLCRCDAVGWQKLALDWRRGNAEKRSGRRTPARGSS